jgi:hypothetical protein
MWKVHVTHDREHDYHNSLHSTEVRQLYPQVGDSITYWWLRLHFFQCTLPKIYNQEITIKSFTTFSSLQIFTLRFHHYGSSILQRPPLVSRLGDKLTPSPKFRKSHSVLLPRTSMKIGKQHATQLSLSISAMCFVMFTRLHVPRSGP